MSHSRLPARLVFPMLLLLARLAIGADDRPRVTEYQIRNLPITISASSIGRFATAHSWYLSINSAALAELTVRDAQNTRHEFAVPPEQWDAFKQTLIDERFFDLADDQGRPVPDGSTQTLTITVGHITRTIRIHYLNNVPKDDEKAQDEIRRTLKVMNQIRSWLPKETEGKLG